MTKTLRRGAARLAFLPVVAAAAPLATIMLPAIPVGAVPEAPAPSVPVSTERFTTESIIFDIAVTGTGRIDVLTDLQSVTRIEGATTTTIALDTWIFSIAAGPDGLLYGITDTIDGSRLVMIADDGTTTVVGDPVGDGMHFLEFPSLDFDPNGAPSVTFPRGTYIGETLTNFARMAEDGSWVHTDFRDAEMVVGSVPQGDGSTLYRQDRSGDLYRYTPGEGSELIDDLPDGYFHDLHIASNALAGTSDGTVYFMDGVNIQRRLPSGVTTTVGTLNTELNPIELVDFGRPRVLFGSESRVYVSTLGVLHQLDLDKAGPVITVTGLANDAALKQGEARQVTVGCDDPALVTACSLTLNGKSVETVSLSGLGRGRHRLVIEATDTFGNTSSKAIEFGVTGKREITGDLAEANGTGGTVARLYMAVFSRQPDGAGQGYWVAQRSAGASMQTIAKMFVTSPEFRETYDDLDDDEFLTVLYRNVMDREPDAEGLAYWKQLIDGGMSRAEATLWFSESVEFQHLTFTS